MWLLSPIQLIHWYIIHVFYNIHDLVETHVFGEMVCEITHMISFDI